MPRLGSKKSRKGCQQCKRRRVKCDEQAPCAGCARYGFECSLLSVARPLPLIGSHIPYTPKESPPNEGSPRPASSAPAALLNSASPSNSSATSLHRTNTAASDNVAGEWMSDLELMHHYTAHAHLSLPGSTQAKQAWGYNVPQEALRHTFLMHCILAFSAYHLAHINPSCQQRYRILASTHQAAALNELNHVLVDVNARNCHAIFAAASLITLNAFVDTDEAGVDSLIEIFQLLRGMDAILESMESLVHTGPFAVILRQINDPPKPPPLLSTMIAELQTAAAIEQDDSARMATMHLKDAMQYGIEHSGHAALRTVMLWPIKIDTTFIELLRSRQSVMATNVLEQYLKVLQLAGTEWWFLSGWRNIAR